MSVVAFEHTRMVTLTSPTDGLEDAENAFVRLRPTEDVTEDELRTWRDEVEKVAVAVRVVAPNRTKVADDPAARPRTTRGVREEAKRIARESGGPELEALVDDVLDAAEPARTS